MTEQKVWWQSRTIWTGIVGTLFAILGGFDIIPADLIAGNVVEAILGVTSVLAIVFRVQAKTEIAPLITE